MTTIFTILAILATIIIWGSRVLEIKQNLINYRMTKKRIYLKAVTEIVKIFAIDLLFSVTVISIVGTKSIFALMIVIWLNAITTIFSRQLISLMTITKGR